MKGSPRTIYSFSWLALREAVHSRLAAAAAILVAATILLVFRAADPGDTDGAHNFVFYSVVGCEIVLSLAALVAGAAAVSGEREGKTLKLVRVKPVAMWKFWLGRWLGLVAMFAALLAFSLFLIWLGARRDPESAICSMKVSPSFPSIQEEAEAMVRAAEQDGVDDPAQLAEIRREALARLPFASAALEADEEWRFPFHLEKPLDGSRPISLCVAFSSDSFSPVPLSVSCSLSDDSGTRSAAPFAITNITQRLMKIAIDPAPLGGAESLVLRLRHGGESSMPLLMQPRQAVFLMVPECRSAFNFMRSFALFMPVIALLAALGLMLGSLFSLPVAIFCAAGIALSVLSAGYSASDPDIMEDQVQQGSSLVARIPQAFSIATVKALDFAARTATAPAPAEMLADGQFIPRVDISASALWNGCVIPLALMLVSAAVLERKELPR